MEANLNILVSRNDEILSAAVKPKDGKAIAIIGEHESQWQSLPDGFSTESQLVVPIWEGEKQWGQIELRFKPLKRQDFLAFFFEPLTQFIMFVAFFSFILFKFYLGKMLKQLDPSQAIPDRVRSALDTMAEGLLILDAKQNIVLANEAFSVLVKEKTDKLMGRSISKFTWHHVGQINHDEHVHGVKELKYPWEIALESSSLQMNHMLYFELDENTRYTFMVNCSPVLGQSGKAAGVMVSFDDITALEEKEIELRRSKEMAETANRAKSDFLANMSHEIRTPMNAILGFTEVLMRGYGNDAADSKRYLGTIASSGKHLLGLINDILDLSKVEAGRIEVENLPCSIHQIVQDVVKVMGVKANEKAINLEFIANDSMPEFIVTDAGKIRQILTNLVGNSIKFTEQGGVKLITHYKSEKTTSMLSIEVVDTGIGMTQAQAEAVFKPFVQADSSITRRFGGTGLGLTISKRFVEALGGEIRVTSEPGKGSRFIININVEMANGARLLSPEEMMQEVGTNAIEQQTTWTFPEATVLVIDDGDENRDLLKVVLSDAGLNIETAVNGKDGLELALTKSFDLILMDVQMPIMDGYTAVKLMRENGMTIPIIALTAHAMKGAEDACLAAGYSGYMTKPIDIDVLLKHLAEELGGDVSQTISSKDEEQRVFDKEQIQREQQHATLPFETDKSVITSSLAGGNTRHLNLIKRFVTRLHEQFSQIEKAAENGEYETLADLAHWLKGSAGTVGFHDFTEPAEELEKFANQQDTAGINKMISDINRLLLRIEVEDEQQDVMAEEKTSQQANNEQVSVLKNESGNHYVASDKMPPIRSTLLIKSPKLRPMVEKFVIRLDEKMKLMVISLEKGDFEELADLAHWLKGSAGTIGFHDFTDPAIELECSAKDKNALRAKEWLDAIVLMAKHIELTDLPVK